MNEERRYIFGIETRSAGPGKPPIIAGHAAVFDFLSHELTMPNGRVFREVVRPGAFAESISRRDDVLARFEHADILGRVSNGTLRLKEDERGLRYEIDPPDTSAGRDTVALVRRGDVFGASFAFRVRPGGDSWRYERGGTVRELRSVELLDISPVSKPAYTATDVALRSLAGYQAANPQAWAMEMRLALAEASLR